MSDYFTKTPELKSRVFFHGSLGRKELFELYNQSKIFCLPSRFEGFANVYSEAMFFRNAIVTTPSTSLRDIVLDYNCGELAEADNVELLSETLIKIINNPVLNELYATNAKDFCESNLYWDKISDKLQTEIIQRIALKKPASHSCQTIS
ncbi:MAG: glycosyltransferase family 4 protein [Bacteroidetes bacterium]|nr:glycosyltransferase family 4 protein [Bacteroidota bacterium]